MRHIEYKKIVEAVKTLALKAAYELPPDVLTALQKAAQKRIKSSRCQNSSAIN